MRHRNEPAENEWLRETLRRGDPAADGRDPDGPELRRMRRRVLDAAVEPIRLGLPVPALATAAVIVLTVAMGWGIWDGAARRARAPRPVGPTAQPWAGNADRKGDPDRKVRQIQFSTPGGTRVVWTLDPDFEV